MQEINGDRKLSLQEKLRYFAYNGMRALRGMWTRVPSHFYCAKGGDDDTSLCRKYIDAFLVQELPRLLLHTKSILEIGCGSGYLRDLLERLQYAGTYRGIDTRDYATRESRYSYPAVVEEISFEDFASEEKYDLIISITVLEHIADDRKTVAKIATLLAPHGRQLHVLPSAWSLPLYLLHGYRQYSPARVQWLFGATPYTMYRLGGFCTFVVQFLLTTLPERLTGRKVFRSRSWYPRFARGIMRLDRYLPFGSPMYVVER